MNRQLNSTNMDSHENQLRTRTKHTFLKTIFFSSFQKFVQFICKIICTRTVLIRIDIGSIGYYLEKTMPILNDENNPKKMHVICH